MLTVETVDLNPQAFMLRLQWLDYADFLMVIAVFLPTLITINQYKNGRCF